MKRYIIKFFCAIFILALAFSCKTGSDRSSDGAGARQKEMLYAKGFRIAEYDKYSVVEIINPWDTTKLLHRYILLDRNSEPPADLPKGVVIKVPVKRVIIYNSVHTAVFEQLGAVESIVGICESQYVTSPLSLKRIAEGKIKDCGASTSPNIERIAELGGEVIIASPFEHSGYGKAEKLGIPIFEAADYMEGTPLGRAEWIKLYGLLAGKSEVADSSFNATVEHYLSLKELAASSDKRPAVLAERKYGASWFIPGGKSYTSIMYRDAGADYLFNDNMESGSVPLSFETVFERGVNADFWLLKYTMNRPMSYSDMKQEYPPYGEFDAFKKRRVYGCNTTRTGYYEDISTHPDYILEDLVAIFHPDLMKGYKLRYYFPLE